MAAATDAAAAAALWCSPPAGSVDEENADGDGVDVGVGDPPPPAEGDDDDDGARAIRRISNTLPMAAKRELPQTKECGERSSVCLIRFVGAPTAWRSVAEDSENGARRAVARHHKIVLSAAKAAHGAVPLAGIHDGGGSDDRPPHREDRKDMRHTTTAG